MHSLDLSLICGQLVVVDFVELVAVVADLISIVVVAELTVFVVVDLVELASVVVVDLDLDLDLVELAGRGLVKLIVDISWWSSLIRGNSLVFSSLSALLSISLRCLCALSRSTPLCSSLCYGYLSLLSLSLSESDQQRE